MTWISVEDSLPPDYEEVLYFVATEHKFDILVGHRKEGVWYNCYLFYSSTPINEAYGKVTHWMRLPDYPEDRKLLQASILPGAA